MIEAICFDLGDTLVAEETVIHNSCGQAITARVIKGVFEVLETMRKDGYRIGMIANGDSTGARNIINSTGLQDYFDTIIISEEVGIEKPDKQVFQFVVVKGKCQVLMFSDFVSQTPFKRLGRLFPHVRQAFAS